MLLSPLSVSSAASLGGHAISVCDALLPLDVQPQASLRFTNLLATDCGHSALRLVICPFCVHYGILDHGALLPMSGCYITSLTATVSREVAGSPSAMYACLLLLRLLSQASLPTSSLLYVRLWVLASARRLPAPSPTWKKLPSRRPCTEPWKSLLFNSGLVFMRSVDSMGHIGLCGSSEMLLVAGSTVTSVWPSTQLLLVVIVDALCALPAFFCVGMHKFVLPVLSSLDTRLQTAILVNASCTSGIFSGCRMASSSLASSIGRVLSLALRANHRLHRYEDYLGIIADNLRSKHPRCLLEGLPFHLQQDIELSTYNWQWRFTWSFLRADEWDMSQLYSPSVLLQAERYFQHFPRSSLSIGSAGPCHLCSLKLFLPLLQSEVRLLQEFCDWVGVPFHRCPRCIHAMALTCKSALACFRGSDFD